MKIFIVVDDYLPDSIKVGAKMMHELALELIRQGHSATVLTPTTQIKKGYTITRLEDVTVCRFSSGKIKNVSKIRRAINETLLSLRAWIYTRSYLKKNHHDLVIYYSPTIFFGPLIKKLKKIWNVSSYLILRDIFPQWAIDNGLLKENSFITRYFNLFEKINYDAADYIGIQSPNNLKWFRNKYTPIKADLHLLYNWAEDKKTENRNIYRKKWGLEDKVIYFYGGNIGYAQDMLNIVRLAEKMSKQPRAFFILIGCGDEYNLVFKAIEEKKLTNIRVLPSVSQEDFKNILAEMDVGLFSLHHDHKTHNFPGKLLGYMVQGIPILGSINPGNDVKETVENAGAGFVAINGEDEIFYKNAYKLLDAGLRKEMGNNAKKLLRDKFSVNSAAKNILDAFQKETL